MSWRELVDLLTWTDLVDIAIVAVLFYNLLLLIRGTRAVQMLLGLFAVVAVYQVAKLARLRTLETIIQSFFILLPIAIIVLFQEEIRRALANIGRNPLLVRAHSHRLKTALDIVARAAEALSERKLGALIVIERQEGLRNFSENGIRLDAIVSLELLVNLFTRETPLHDGAVVIRAGRIAAACCFLPLSSDPNLAREIGSRHRAAIGISEQTDAVAVVVSEETAEISVAVNGRLLRALDGQALRTALADSLLAPARAEAQPAAAT
jgi:diadenylate cyclase